jgi:hypothetical protein
MSRSTARDLILAAAAATLLGACATVANRPSKSAKAMRDFNNDALAAFQAGDLPKARKLLASSIAVGKRAGLEDDTVMASTHLDLGAVFLAQNDREAALRQLGLALSIDPSVQPAPDIASSALNKALTAARSQLKRGRGPAATAVAAREKAEKSERSDKEEAPAPKVITGPAVVLTAPPAAKEKESPRPVASSKRKRATAEEEPDLPATVPQPVYCPVPDEAPPESDISLACVPRPGVDVAKMVLFYRSAGSETFNAVDMTRSPKGWYRGVVPANAVVGKSLQYYVEAQSPRPGSSTNNGQADSPNLVLIRDGASPIRTGSLALAHKRSAADLEEEDPLARAEREQAVHEESGGDVHRRRPGAIFAGASLGSGMGWHPERPLEFRTTDKVAAGFSPASLVQISPEIGYQLDDRWAFSLQTRHQMIPETGSGDDKPGAPAHGAFAVFARVYRFIGLKNGQPFITASVGVGDGFRLVVPPHPEMGVNRNDSIQGGPFVVGPGAGYLYQFNRYFGWIAEARVLAGLPKSAVLAEISTGAQLAY